MLTTRTDIAICMLFFLIISCHYEAVNKDKLHVYHHYRVLKFAVPYVAIPPDRRDLLVLLYQRVTLKRTTSVL